MRPFSTTSKVDIASMAEGGATRFKDNVQTWIDRDALDLTGLSIPMFSRHMATAP
jgi:hypothetical protein